MGYAWSGPEPEELSMIAQCSWEFNAVGAWPV